MIKKNFCLSALTFIIVAGGEGYRVEKPEELDKALEPAFKSDKPAIVDVVVDSENMVPKI
jgi:thiamine pyrophosphate-dependent acetolactate synthase large subunit-like protein